MFLKDYQTIASQTDQKAHIAGDRGKFLYLGLFGEVGTLLSALKKKQRDTVSYVGYTEAIFEELGDVLWYFSAIATSASFSLDEIAIAAGCVERLPHSADTSFSELTRRVEEDVDEFENALITLAGKVGILLNANLEIGESGDADSIKGHLCEIFSSIIYAANMANIDLEVTAELNIKKVTSRWPVNREPTPLFDEDCPHWEQFPRIFKIEIHEIGEGDKASVIQRCNGVNIGSRLTDNKKDPDDFVITMCFTSLMRLF